MIKKELANSQVHLIISIKKLKDHQFFTLIFSTTKGEELVCLTT